MDKTYICIDLKSFYASVECAARGLDPLRTNLVVADASRTEKTICLAVSPSLKAYKIPGRARLFEVVSRVGEINRDRRAKIASGTFSGKSYDAKSLAENPELELSYIIAPPRMAEYIRMSTKIYSIYLEFAAPEDMHIYSIDEVFIDATGYLRAYGGDAHEYARAILSRVLEKTGITATVGIGTNMYLAKVAMDIEAKHAAPDENGARIAKLDEVSYRRLLWKHTPITDFWRVGKGYEKKLASVGLYTMGDVAKCSMGERGEYYSEELLYKLFGVNAELLIDHAWGYEPCTIAEVKAYRPESSSISSGQVLSCPYSFDKARIVVREMTELLTLELVEKRLEAGGITLDVGYDRENAADAEKLKRSRTTLVCDPYGRRIPKGLHRTVRFDKPTSSTRRICEAMCELFDSTENRDFTIRRMTVTADRLVEADRIRYEQLDLFGSPVDADGERERSIQLTMIDIKKQFGKNAVMRGMNLQEGATAISRNGQIGGHKK